jgi:hypothetical protein
MDEPKPPPAAYKIVGVGTALIVVALAVGLLLAIGPKLRRATPAQQLAAVLQRDFPSADPQVVSSGAGSLAVHLQVQFDPTVEADQVQTVFMSIVDAAEAEALEGVSSLEVELAGVSLEGRPTSATRTFDYEPRSAPGSRGNAPK